MTSSNTRPRIRSVHNTVYGGDGHVIKEEIVRDAAEISNSTIYAPDGRVLFSNKKRGD